MSEYSPEEKEVVMDMVKSAILHGLDHNEIIPIVVSEYPENLQQQRACFITLEKQKNLRGCIGSLQARKPLIEDIAYNAFAAAFRDPRFPPVSKSEYTQLAFHVSILTEAKPMQFDSEQDLLSQLQPGVDGLIFSDRGMSGTFLPSVWEQLPQPEEFLLHLKQKAGLPANHWSDSVQVHRYTTVVIE